MKFNHQIVRYLKGEQFSNGLYVPTAQKEATIPDRLTLLERIVQNRKIIHLGCVDHLPLIKTKIQGNTWLHARLSQCTRRCLGIDINPEGIAYLQTKLGYQDVVCMDILEDDAAMLKSETWDYMIIGELLEHTDNPVQFLSVIREKYQDYINGLVITVPNAFAWANFIGNFRQQECINSDHRYWFTPYTLGKIVTQAGMSVRHFQFCERFPSKASGRKRRLRNLLTGHNFVLKRYPAFRQVLVMEVEI